jgi:precorrin-6A/cobalt-precorrin-6A reductase
MTRLLILGGTTEAVALAQALHDQHPKWDIVTSLAGVTRKPVTGPGRLREGGFGGVAGLVDYLRAESIDALIDATHPFAATMARHAEQAAGELGIARIKLVRPMWDRTTEDRWIAVESPADAARTLQELGARSVFMTLGRRDLEAFAGLTDTRFITRMIEPPAQALPLARAELILARGPFTVDDEESLMRDHQVDALVTKASGGAATQAKIIAARNLSVPVVMVTRPDMPGGPGAESVDDVVAWLESVLHTT